MAKPPGIPFEAAALRALFSKKNAPLNHVAKRMGVTRQALNSWLQSERIPPRRLTEIGMLYDITHEEMQRIIPQDSKPRLKAKINALEDQLRRIWDILNED